MRVIHRFSTGARRFLADPQREALAYAGLGILGLIFAVIGLFFILGGGDDGDSRPQASADHTATASQSPTQTVTRTPTRTPTPRPTATRTPSPSPTPTATPTPQPRSSGSGGSGESQVQPTATPTTPAVVAGGPYCNGTSGALGGPPVRVIGTLVIAGAPVAAGTNVSLAFDGVFGPAELTTDAGGYAIDFFQGASDCANRQGAAISVVVNGRFFPTGYHVGDGGAGFIRFDINAP